ncbi:MAG: RNase adapter RapZ [Burkholderiales bacterium]|nr:RNase adapter RapZ [Burkholderiales bacterium]
MQIILVLGVSGAGKNVALGALEDIGFAIVNNLPAALLVDTVEAMLATHTQSLGISLNAHSPTFVHDFDHSCIVLRARHVGTPLRVIRIDASDQTLQRRFAETRRKHPFSNDQTPLAAAIAEERARLRAVLHDQPSLVHDLDTSATSTHLLRQRVRQFATSLDTNPALPLLEISSFAYREGIPPDADLVFDARILPNPYYEPGLAALTGRDVPVVAFLQAQPETAHLIAAMAAYVRASLPGFVADNRPRIHVAIGCTGGKHRSVYVANALQAALSGEARVLRHDREHPLTS